MEKVNKTKDKLYEKTIEGLNQDITRLNEENERIIKRNNERFNLIEKLLLNSDMINDGDKIDIEKLKKKITYQEEEDVKRKKLFLENKKKLEDEIEKIRAKLGKIIDNDKKERENLLKKHLEEEEEFKKRHEHESEDFKVKEHDKEENRSNKKKDKDKKEKKTRVIETENDENNNVEEEKKPRKPKEKKVKKKQTVEEVIYLD